MKHSDMPWPGCAAASSLAACVLVGAGVFGASPADAADKAPILTQAQLRDCLAQKDRLRKDTDAALKSKAEIDAVNAEIDGSGAALAAEGATLDRTNAEAVSAYNARVAQRDALVESFQAKAAAYNKEAEGVLATKKVYARACENRRFDDRDLSDLQRKK